MLDRDFYSFEDSKTFLGGETARKVFSFDGLTQRSWQLPGPESVEAWFLRFCRHIRGKPPRDVAVISKAKACFLTYIFDRENFISDRQTL